MIKVTVLAGEGKFAEFQHPDGNYWSIEAGTLFIQQQNGNDDAAYAPGAWLKVEYGDKENS